MISLSDLPFSGVSELGDKKSLMFYSDITKTLSLLLESSDFKSRQEFVDPSWKNLLLRQDQSRSVELQNLLASEPKSEPAMFYALSKLVGKNVESQISKME